MTVLSENSAIVTDPRLKPGGITLTRELPGGHTIVYSDYPAGTWLTAKGDPAKTQKRGYLLDGKKVESVTEFCDAMRKKALENWLEREAAIGAVMAERMGELDGVDPQDFARRARMLGLGAGAKRDEAADRGTIIHDALHTLATTGTAPNPADVPALGRPWIRGALSAWLTIGPTEVVEAEQPVASVEHGYAGRPDLVVVDSDGRCTLIDWKSGKGRAYPEVHYQLRLYWMALLEMGIPVDRACALAINDEGGFELVECGISEAEALALITVSRSRKRVDNQMAAQRRLTEKLAKA